MAARSRARFGLASRGTALAMALVATVSIRPARGAPGDIFSVAAPVVGTAPPKAGGLNDGDASVSTQTGALQYNYPIAVPPGRNGMQPHLALAYSSQAPIYGTVAAGWSLSIPMITEDTSKGRLWQQATPIKTYTSSMAGGRPLIQVTEPTSGSVATYRGQGDSSFVRYQRADDSGGYWWRALSPDGTTYYFGDADHVAGCSIVSDEYAPLTRVIDPFGNLVDYNYQAGVDGECRIATIQWGKNASAAVEHFASLTFAYASSPLAPCQGIPVGSQTSYRTGTKIVTGASQLDSITAAAYPPGVPSVPGHQRVITLAYSNPGYPAGNSSCHRQLSSITESAWGTDAPRVNLPAITFTYGGASISGPAFAGDLSWPVPVESTMPWNAAAETPWAPKASSNLGWGYRFTGSNWPTVEAMMIDLDGDGLIDRLTNRPTVDGSGKIVSCGAQWERNQGPGLSFTPPVPIRMPTLKWASPDRSTCAAAYKGGDYANHSASLITEGLALPSQNVVLRLPC